MGACDKAKRDEVVWSEKNFSSLRHDNSNPPNLVFVNAQQGKARKLLKYTMTKRKDPPSNDTHEQTPVKKAKKHKSEKSGGHRGHESSRSSKEFMVVQARMNVTIPPLYSGPGRPRQAVEEMLDSMLMKLVPLLPL